MSSQNGKFPLKCLMFLEIKHNVGGPGRLPTELFFRNCMFKTQIQSIWKCINQGLFLDISQALQYICIKSCVTRYFISNVHISKTVHVNDISKRISPFNTSLKINILQVGSGVSSPGKLLRLYSTRSKTKAFWNSTPNYYMVKRCLEIDFVQSFRSFGFFLNRLVKML